MALVSMTHMSMMNVSQISYHNHKLLYSHNLTHAPPHSSCSHPCQPIHLLSKYSDYIPSENIVQQLLHLDNKELVIPLPGGPTFPAPENSSILRANLALNKDVTYLTSANKHNPSTLCHVQRSRYWSEWLTTMHEELEALKAQNVYEEVDLLPPRPKAVKSKWVLHIKWDKDGQISCFKGCLVAQGFTQIFGQDFTFTFTPVACWESIWTILCIAALNDYKLRHIDVKNAYLNAPLEEEIYMIAPEGCKLPYW